ncbi:MAG TPA: hypothetical protein VFT45_18780 [Longimicrobium sp.]|nr:hypothetical protein [Longimicrobium sp.]
MPIHTVADAPPAAAGLDPVLREPLPALVMGERAEIHREHEWPGSLFFILSYVAAVGMGAGALGGAAFGVFSGKLWMVGMAVGLGVGAVVQWRLAKEVEHFSRWGWYGAMVELAGAAAANVWGMAHGNVVGGMMGVGIDLAWMRYFWEYRAQFDIDIDG